jgi:hypothetical protein
MARRAVVDPVYRLIVDVARANPTDSTRTVAACGKPRTRPPGEPQADAAGDTRAAAAGTSPAGCATDAAPASSASSGQTISGTST